MSAAVQQKRKHSELDQESADVVHKVLEYAMEPEDVVNREFATPVHAELDRRGDLFLLVQGKVTLRVSSQILRLASPVFDAMLSSSFREGQQILSELTPGQIELPEDDAAGMVVICCLLHHRSKYIQHHHLYWQTMLEASIIADKYDCVSVVRAHLEHCLERFFKDGELIKLEKELSLLAAASMLQEQEWFGEYFKRIVWFDNENLIEKSFTERLSGYLPANICFMILCHRSTLRADFLQSVYKLISQYVSIGRGHSVGCACSGCIPLPLSYPTIDVSVLSTPGALLEGLIAMPGKSIHVLAATVCGCASRAEHIPNLDGSRTFGQELRCLIERFEGEKGGTPCLICCREGSLSGAIKCQQFDHLFTH